VRKAYAGLIRNTSSRMIFTKRRYHEQAGIIVNSLSDNSSHLMWL
jgi:hypothetical protein